MHKARILSKTDIVVRSVYNTHGTLCTGQNFSNKGMGQRFVMLGLPFGPNTSGYHTGFSKEETTQLNTKEDN